MTLEPPSSPQVFATSSPHVNANLAEWDRRADEYQHIIADLGLSDELRWGWWGLLEAEHRILGDIVGKDLLDLGCGPARGTVKLARLGARAVGLDGSARQLEHAREHVAKSGIEVPLVHGDAEQLPFADASFDIVVSMWGAVSFCDPYAVVPEAARVLRPGGLVAISTWSHIYWLCTDEETQEPQPTLRREYFGLQHSSGPSGTVRFQLPYGDWIRLFRDHGLQVENLVEPPAPPDAAIPKHLDEEKWRSWSMRWPFECIWSARKAADA